MAPAVLYCTQGDLEEYLSIEGVIARADDDNTGRIDQTVSVLTAYNPNQQRFISRALNWGTDRVNFYCLTLYAAADLATSDMVNQWAVVCAARWACGRRCNPVPGSILEQYKDTLADLALVKSSSHQVPDIGYRDVAWPAWSNVSINPGYLLRKTRVERPISERTPTPYPQNVDHAADFIFEP